MIIYGPWNLITLALSGLDTYKVVHVCKARWEKGQLCRVMYDDAREERNGQGGEIKQDETREGKAESCIQSRLRYSDIRE